MIVITTPTGDIGSQVLGNLFDSDQREDLRVIVRDPARLSAAVRDRVDIVTGSHADADVVDRAFAGADAVFWLVPPDAQAPSLHAAYCGFTQAAAKAFTAHGVGSIFVLLAGMYVVLAACALFAPETRGRSLEDTSTAPWVTVTSTSRSDNPTPGRS